MQSPKFLHGTLQQFSTFIKSLNDLDKIALVSHRADVDGIVSAKMVNAMVKPDVIKLVGYTNINEALVAALKKEKISRVIFTDLNIKNPSIIEAIEKFAHVLIIDHHPPIKDYNSAKTVFLNAKGYCAAFLTYYLFSKVQDLSHLSWLVVCASIADWEYQKNAPWMQEQYALRKQPFISTIEGIKKSEFWNLQEIISLAIIYWEKKNIYHVLEQLGDSFGSLGDLPKYSKKVQQEINTWILKFQQEKIPIHGGYFYEISPKFDLNSIISTTLSATLTDKTIIIATNVEGYYKISARRQDGKVDLNILLTKLTAGLLHASGGGHHKAAGASCRSADAPILKQRILQLSDRNNFLQQS